MKKIVLAALLGCSLMVVAKWGLAQALDRVVARVNQDIITQTELNQAVNIMTQQLKHANMAVPDTKTLRQKALDQLIARKIQLQVIKKANVKVTDEQIDGAIKNIAERNHFTIAQLKEQLAKEGVTYAKFRKQIEEQILFGQLQQQVAGGNITVSEQEVSEFMRAHPQPAAGPEFYHLQDILVALPEEPNAQQVQAAQEKAEKIMEKVKSATDFQVAAKTFVEDASSHDVEIHDLGWRKLNEIPSLFEKTVKSMKAGEVIGPVRAPNGYHILKLADKRSQGGEKLTRDLAKKMVYQKKLDEKMGEWIKKMRGTSYIKIEKIEKK